MPRTQSEENGPATIKEVAKLAGVAPSSVSRVLNDHPDVSMEMRARVMRASDRLGYQPDFVAQSLRRGATTTIGFLVRDISNPLFADIVKGAETTLRSAGYSMVLTNSLGDPDLDAEHIRMLRRRRVDGLILSLQSETHPPTLDALRSATVPLVLVDREVPEIQASSVLNDHYVGVRRATEHLLDLGHRRIGFLAGPRDIRASRERYRGYESAHQAAGVSIEPDVVRFGSYTRQFGYDETRALMEEADRPPTALIAAGVQLAIGLLAALRELHVEVGRDVSVVACDEVELMRFIAPPISVVLRDSERIGRLAAELLLDVLLEGGEPRTETIPTEYVPRGSSTPPA